MPLKGGMQSQKPNKDVEAKAKKKKALSHKLLYFSWITKRMAKKKNLKASVCFANAMSK